MLYELAANGNAAISLLWASAKLMYASFLLYFLSSSIMGGYKILIRECI